MNENDSQYFEVNLNLYSGPLNTLLDLAKAQKVDLEKLSITKLADQFYEFITKSDNINLEVAFDDVFPSSRHKSGVAMRFPRIHRIRWDKPINEVVSIEEFKKEFKIS